MAPENGLPDFLVGIDFGQTYTGVVWNNLHIGSQSQPRSIQDWPGLPPHSVETKVPSTISYPQDGSEPRWGFLCDPDDDYYEIAQVREHFKIYLDQESLDLAHSNDLGDIPRTVGEAKELVTDYLRQIHQHTKFSIEAVTGSWKDKTVEFVFSLPTTWNSLDTINRFKDAIDAAGFNVDSPARHSATVELTEAEAAAVYIATSPQVTLARGDIILVCDAGGGTTDLGLIEVLDPDARNPALRQVAAVKGVGIGSTMIDRAFELLVQRRLDTHVDHNLPEDLAQKVARSSSFQSIKHKFGIPAAEKNIYTLPLDRLGLGISPDFTHAQLRIRRGKMQFSKLEIQGMFDAQIKGIVGQITKQLDSHKCEKPVKILFLSGGLGGSTYVNAQIQAYYQNNPHINAPGLVILRSQEPQLGVVKGLVMDRRQKILSGAAALKTRIARASYGVICRRLYNKNLHVGEAVVMDSFNKKEKWASSQIDWLIKKEKGDIIDTDTAREKSFNIKLHPGDQNRKWDVTVVISHDDQKTLPTSFHKPGVYKLCQVYANLEGVSESEFQLKNKRAWQGEAYYIATFTVKVIVGPADLKFELWFKDKRYNGTHDPISIEWDSTGASLRPQSRDGPADYWETAVSKG